MDLQTTLKSNSQNWQINLSSWGNKLVALIALVNLILCLFIINIYLRHFPAIVNLYDPVKSIERHSETSPYLNTVYLLTTEINEKGLQAPSMEPLLASLPQQSAELLEENPFLVGNINF